ncbi:MAG: HU family DNA-binding protein [Tannerellaceae bacterium]|jgi:predicted histone-like DNA-binding protein|nr:HU family DNA-binding protein [Tannerellaceae bacterium]
MALKIRKVQRKLLSGDEQGKVKTYGIAKAGSYCNLAKLCKLISARSAMSSADVKAILDSLNWAMDLELQAGNIVQVGEFGNFRLSVSSEGTEEESDYKASKVKKARIVFSPGVSLRRSISEVSFELDDVVVKEIECNQSHA